jgi:electron transport complex protein RnfE
MNTVNAAPVDARWRDFILALSVCPLLAVSDTISNAIGLGVTVLCVLALSQLLGALIVRWLEDEWRLAAMLIVVTGVASGAFLLLRAVFPMLYQALGIFPLLIAANIVVGMQLIAPETSIIRRVIDSVKLGGQIAVLLLILGIARELVGRGSIFHDAGTQFGDWARSLQLFRADMGFLLAMLPPGAFISLGLLLALRNWLLDRRRPS